MSNFAFTENAAFRNLLLVFEKSAKTDGDYLTGIVLLRPDLDTISIEEAKKTAKEILSIRMGEDKETKDFDIYWVKPRKLIANNKNLIPFVATSTLKNRKIIEKFLEKCAISNKTMKIKSEWLKEGLRNTPEGISKILSITNPIDPSRVERA